MVIGKYFGLGSAQTLSGEKLQGRFPGKDIDVVFLQRVDATMRDHVQEVAFYRATEEYANVVGIRTKGLIL